MMGTDRWSGQGGKRDKWGRNVGRERDEVREAAT